MHEGFKEFGDLCDKIYIKYYTISAVLINHKRKIAQEKFKVFNLLLNLLIFLGYNGGNLFQLAPLMVSPCISNLRPCGISRYQMNTFSIRECVIWCRVELNDQWEN